MAVAEYAKSRGKSSNSAVRSGAGTSSNAITGGARILRVSAICTGLAVAGLSMQVTAANEYEGDIGGNVYTGLFGDLNVKGGVSTLANLTHNNIGVVGTDTGFTNTLTIKLAKDLTGLNSATFGGVVISKSGLNNGNNKIIHVANGDINATSKDAVNGSQLNSLTNTVAANKTKYYSVNSSAIGNANNLGATGQNAMAMGGNATATGSQAIAIGSGESGQNTTASGEQSIAIGANVVSKGASSIAIGGDDLDRASQTNISTNTLSGLNAGEVNTKFKYYAGGRDLVGNPKYADHTESGGAASIAVGAKSQSEGALSTAIGVHSSSSGIAASAFGVAASASGKGSIALGAGSKAQVDEGIALGSMSVANRAGGGPSAVGYASAGATIADKAAITITESMTLGAVSVGTGDKKGNRQIINVAAGSENSDAVNVAQLKQVVTLAEQETAVEAGRNITVSSVSNSTGGRNYTVKTDDNVTFGTVNIGDATSKTTLTHINNGTDKGLDVGDSYITNVARGSVDPYSKDAINGSQLHETNQNIAKGIKFNLNGGERTYALGETIGVTTGTNIVATPTATGANFDLAPNLTGLNSATFGSVVISQAGLNNGGNQITKVASGGVRADAGNANNAANIGDLNTAVTDVTTAGFGLKAADGGTVQKPLGGAIELVGSNNNVTTKKVGDKVEIDLNNNLDLSNTGSVKIGSGGFLGLGNTTTLDRSGLTTGNSLLNTTVDGLGVRTGNALVNTTVSSLGVAVSNPFSTAILSGNGLNIIGGPSVTNAGVNAGNKKITNVDNGIAPKDAVNVSQLNTTNQEIAKGIKFNVDGLERTYALGETIGVTTDDNIDVTTTADGAKFGLANVVNIGTANPIQIDGTAGTITTGATTINNGGLSITGGPSVILGGIDGGNQQITGVASGVGDDKNAANIGDVQTIAGGLKTIITGGTNIAGVTKSTTNGQDTYTVNADSASASGSTAVTVTAGAKNATTNNTDYVVDLSDASKTSLVKANSAMQTVETQIDGTTVKTVDKTDNTANFVTGDNIVLSDDNGSIKVATAKDLVLTSVTTGNTLVNDAGITITGGTNQTITLSNTGLDNGGNKIINVADGEADTDAVNVGQLNATNSTVDMGLNFTGDDTAVVVNRKLGQILTVKGGATDLTDNNIGIVADEDGNLNVKLAKDLTGLNSADFGSGVSLSANGLNNGGNKITNVAEGTTIKDAVNFGQLSATNENVAINTSNITTNTTNIGINTEDIAKGIRIGDGDSNNDQQFALGDTINVTGDSNLTTTASATGVQVQLNNQLNLGNAGSMQIGNSIMNNTGFTFANSGSGRTVILSDRGLDNGGNTIRNVGTGTLNSDAVNVGQLRDVTIALDQGWGITAQGDIATMVKQGGSVDMGSRDGNITVSRTLFSNAATLDSSKGLIPAGANDLSFDLNPDLTVDSLTAGDTTINSNGLTIAGGPSVTKSGINAADNKITNVQNGSVSASSQDAINGSQLFAQGTGISSIIGGSTVYNPADGTFTNSNIGGTGEGSIDGAIGSIRQGTIEVTENVQVNTTNIETNTTNIATNTSNIATNTTNITSNTGRIDAGLNFGADSGANINKPVGDESVLSFTGSNNIKTMAEGSSIKFDLNGDINLESVTTGNTTINSNGVSMTGGPSMTAAGIYAGDVTTGPSMTMNGISAGGKVMTDVADGIGATDAVNFGQLSALDKRLGNNMNELGYKIGEVEDDANAGISAAMAMSSLPQAYIIGKSMVGGGIATYNGESAVAVGVSKLSDDGRWVIKVNGTADTQGNVGGAIGAGFHFN
jgi:autotransporter adhesin